MCPKCGGLNHGRANAYTDTLARCFDCWETFLCPIQPETRAASPKPEKKKEERKTPATPKAEVKPEPEPDLLADVYAEAERCHAIIGQMVAIIDDSERRFPRLPYYPA